MVIGEGLARLTGYGMEVRYSTGSRARATVAAQLATSAYTYFSGLFAGVEPDIALIVADEPDWLTRQPYGMPYFSDDADQIRSGVVVMPAGRGQFWSQMVRDLRDASPDRYAQLATTYPSGSGRVDLQPFFDLITIHELGHAFEALGDLRLATHWLSEIFVNLAMHTFVATQQPARLSTLETLPTIGAESQPVAAQMRTQGYSTLEQLQEHYTGGDDPMSPLNYVWFQYRWQRLAADVFAADGEHTLIRFWDCFHSRDRVQPGDTTPAALAHLLASEVSPTLGRAINDWR